MDNNMGREYEMSIEWKGDRTHQSSICINHGSHLDPSPLTWLSDVTTEELSCDDKLG